MAQSDSKNAEVAIIKGENPEKNVLSAIEKLGGMSNFINEGDQVFIKINLCLPYGFPTNTNFDVLKAIVESCNKSGAKKVYVGSFPFNGVITKAISDILGLRSYFENIGAELVLLDNSVYYFRKSFNSNKIKIIKDQSFSKVQINNKSISVPKVILNSDKFISLNQVNVDPIFKYRLSTLNSYSMVSNKYQEIKKVLRKGKDYFKYDQYKQDLISNIIDVFAIKKPDLVINDLFFLLEGAGPYIYKDSKIKKTGIMVIGNDVIAVDSITSKILNFEEEENDLLLEAIERRLGTTDLSKIKIIGENFESININVENCVDKLDNINVTNFSIKTGQVCSGCFRQAYHLLNLMKTNMNKDLKYISTNSFLIGENPPEPDSLFKNNTLVFGDCAITSTKKSNFRKNIVESKKTTSLKENKKILELPGCPPDIYNCLELIINYFGRKNVPNLNLLNKTNKYFVNKKIREKIEMWEEL